MALTNIQATHCSFYLYFIEMFYIWFYFDEPVNLLCGNHQHVSCNCYLKSI